MTLTLTLTLSSPVPDRAWSVTDTTELLSFKLKSILTGDLNDKHSFWNSAVSNFSGEKPMAFIKMSKFEISTPQCPTCYSPAGNGDVLNIVVHQNIRVPDATVSDILDSGHLPVIFHIQDHVKIKNLS
jgi:hypothetical protein